MVINNDDRVDDLFFSFGVQFIDPRAFPDEILVDKYTCGRQQGEHGSTDTDDYDDRLSRVEIGRVRQCNSIIGSLK